MEVAKKTAPTPAPAAPARQPNAVVTPVFKFIRPELTNEQFLAKLAKSKKLAKNNATTKSAAEKITESEKAQNTPAEESQASSNEKQVKELQSKKVDAKTKDESTKAFQEGIRKSVPSSLEEISDFKSSGKSKEIGKVMMQTVNKDVADVKSGFGGISTPKPPAPAEKGIELPPMEEAHPVEQINPGAGIVPPVEEQVIDNSKYLKESDDVLKKEEISQEQLDIVDKGDLAEGNKERKNLNKEATAQPAAIKQMAITEQKTLNSEMHAEERHTRADMQKHRQKHLNETGTKQDKTKTELEKKREEVAQYINNRYETCQKSITGKLNDLEKNSLAQFDAGQEKATKEFENQVNADINRFKTKRYDRFGGSVLWLKDKLCGIDDFPEVKQAFDRARADFEKKIDVLIATITKTNNEVIAGCKKELEDTKAEIADYVKKLGPQLRDIGRKAEAEVGKKLQALSSDIDSRKEKMQQALADKRKAAMEAIDKKIAAMKEAMSGLLSKIGAFLLWAAKKFFKWALEAVGISPEELMSIIDKGIAIIKAIVTKPIVFVKNLIKAASTGFQNFGKNFLKHLKDAIFNWLTGALEGVKLPEVWDAKGILMLVLDILGLTYQELRKRMVVVLGETVVSTLEKTFALVKTLVTEGPAAAWEQMKEMAAEMKTTFIDAVKSWIQTTIIYKAIETVISLFIPGAGIIKAIIAIYDTVMFFIQKAKDIAKMIGDFLGSIGEIAMGNIGAAANALEGGLAKALALVINFLARFLRLSGITDKIRKVIETIRGKVGAVLDKIVAWIQKMAGKLVGKKDEKSQPSQTANDNTDTEVGKLVNFNAENEQHKIWIEQKGSNLEIMVASHDPSPVIRKLEEWRKIAEKDNKKELPNINKAVDLYKKLMLEAKTAKEKMLNSKSKKDENSLKQAKEIDDKVETDEETLARIMKDLFAEFGGKKEPDAATVAAAHGEFQAITDKASSHIGSIWLNVPSIYLTDGEKAAADEKYREEDAPWLWMANYGKAVERYTKINLIRNTEFKAIGGANNPDFVGKSKKDGGTGKFDGLTFDITTVNQSTIDVHVRRENNNSKYKNVIITVYRRNESVFWKLVKK